MRGDDIAVRQNLSHIFMHIMYLYACLGTLQCTYVYLCISINCICLCLFYTVHMLACFRTWGHYYFLQGMCVFSLFPLSNIPSSCRTFPPNVKYLASWVVVNYLLLEVPRDKIWMMLYLRVIQKLQKFHVNSIEFTLRKNKTMCIKHVITQNIFCGSPRSIYFI